MILYNQSGKNKKVKEKWEVPVSGSMNEAIKAYHNFCRRQ
jgi:hypothetical protein